MPRISVLPVPALNTPQTVKTATLSAKTKLAHCATLTKDFISRSIQRPRQWSVKNARKSIESEWKAAALQCRNSLMRAPEATERVLPKASELIAVAIRRVVCEEAGALVCCRKRQQQRLYCSVQHGSLVKKSETAVPSRDDKKTTASSHFEFNEKFVFERLEEDQRYGEITIEIGSANEDKKIGDVRVDLDIVFAEARGYAPVEKTSIVHTMGASTTMVDYVVHRIPVETTVANSAAKKLSRSDSSLNDDADMEAFGPIFPALWYLMPDNA